MKKLLQKRINKVAKALEKLAAKGPLLDEKHIGLLKTVHDILSLVVKSMNENKNLLNTITNLKAYVPDNPYADKLSSLIDSAAEKQSNAFNGLNKARSAVRATLQREGKLKGKLVKKQKI